MKKNVMFYGFLRFSLRFAFWTMPTKHPVMTGILGNLSKLKADETREMLGGDALPWMLGRIRFGDKTYVDLARANPVTNSLVSVATAQGLDAKFFSATGMFPPIYGMAFSQVAQRDPFTGKPWKVEGETQPRNYVDVGLEERGRIALGQGLSMFYPYRTWSQISEDGKPVGSDSLAFDPRPTQYTESYRTKPPEPGQYVLQESFPLGGLFFQSLREADRDKKIAKGIRENIAEEKARLTPSDDSESEAPWMNTTTTTTGTAPWMK